jgi:hypothetical protein
MTPGALNLSTALSVNTIEDMLQQSCIRGFRVAVKELQAPTAGRAKKSLTIHFDDMRDLKRFRERFQQLAAIASATPHARPTR